MKWSDAKYLGQCIVNTQTIPLRVIDNCETIVGGIKQTHTSCAKNGGTEMALEIKVCSLCDQVGELGIYNGVEPGISVSPLEPPCSEGIVETVLQMLRHKHVQLNSRWNSMEVDLHDLFFLIQVSVVPCMEKGWP